MTVFALAMSTALCLTAVPAFAGSPAGTINLAQLDVRIGEGGVRIGERDHDRDRGHMRRNAEGDRGCREIVTRERRGGEVVVTKTRRCY
jgi:hypothetical protein